MFRHARTCVLKMAPDKKNIVNEIERFKLHQITNSYSSTENMQQSTSRILN